MQRRWHSSYTQLNVMHAWDQKQAHHRKTTSVTVGALVSIVSANSCALIPPPRLSDNEPLSLPCAITNKVLGRQSATHARSSLSCMHHTLSWQLLLLSNLTLPMRHGHSTADMVPEVAWVIHSAAFWKRCSLSFQYKVCTTSTGLARNVPTLQHH